MAHHPASLRRAIGGYEQRRFGRETAIWNAGTSIRLRAVWKRTRRFWVVLVVIAVVVGLSVVTAVQPTTTLGLSGRALSNSLEHQLNATNGPLDTDVAVDRCSSTATDRWSCGVEPDPGSGCCVYATLDTTGSGCWRMIKAPPGAGLGAELNVHACVDVLDYLPRPFR
jgi:hypothetical protein